MLKDYKRRVDPILEKYFNKKLKEAQRIDPIAQETVTAIKKFTMSGGKRVRPAFVYYGYLACGGRDCAEILEASTAIELVHTFLLIHDDIIDRDEKRHGIETVHEKYRRIGARVAPKKDSRHFGNSMAIIVGDLAQAMANEIMFNIKFPPDIILKALNELQDIVYVTIPGEMLDVIMENRGRATEKEILRMFEGKTSRYTFEGPLHLGCVLAGGDESMLAAFTNYSLPLGKAFQIQDDILGVFGNEKKLGKPVGSDVIEGKQTLLYIKALKKADPKQKKALTAYLGKKDLTPAQLDDFRRIVKETGSLQYSQALARKLVQESLAALENIPFKNEKAALFLRGIAQYVIEREA